MVENHGPEAATAFLEALFGTADEDLSILIWSLPDKQSRWFGVGGRDGIGEKVQSIDGNVYVGAGLLAESMGPNRRGVAGQIGGIPGVWADIDYGEAGHKKTSLPPAPDDAKRLIDELPVRPSIVVHSGYGYQCWWLLHEFWRFDDAAERERAATLMRGWQAMIINHAQRFGWAADSMADLSRVMRLPGTWNVKREPRQPVLLDELHAAVRYGIEELEQLCPSESRPETEPVSLGAFQESAPPFEKFESLLFNDDEFRRTWEHKRKLDDDSVSGYDLALANIAVRAGWTDEEIANLLIKHRRKWVGEGPKHKEYYEATIGKARVQRGLTEADREMSQQLLELEQSGGPTDRDKVLDLVSKYCGVRVTRLIKVTTENPTYYLETELGTVNLGGGITLDQQGRFRIKMIEFAGKRPRRIKKDDEWNTFVNELLKLTEEREGGVENTAQGSVREWIQSYLAVRPEPQDWDEVIERMGTINGVTKSKSPFLNQSGELCIYSSDLRKFLLNDGEKLSKQDLAAALNRAGCESRTLSITWSGGRTTTYVWSIPPPVYVSD